MIKLKAPARICLFGEHQDYLNYPIIALAISRYIYLEAKKISKPYFLIDLPNINQTLKIPLNNKELDYESKRDYLKSGYNQFLRKGFIFNKGYKIKITGDIPIGAGASSSSALVMAWLSFLNLLSNNPLNKYQLAIEGYNTEVKEFQEAGGKMDFFTSSYGNLIYLDLQFEPDILNFNIKLDGFVLGNSLEKKNTVQDLIRVKSTAIDAFNTLKEIFPEFDKYTTKLESVNPYLPNLKKEFQKKIFGNLNNRDITFKAKQLILNYFNLLKIQKKKFNQLKIFYQELGKLLNLHQMYLKNDIEISTNKINTMIDSSLNAGALGAKINGSGFGGTMFALSPGNEVKVKQAIQDAGGVGYIIKTSNGVETY